MHYNLNNEIYFVSNKMEDYLHFNRLFRAICLVKDKYLKIEVENPTNKTDLLKHQERVFAYELYRQWANIIDAECETSLILNAELDKIISDRIENKQNKTRTYPDMVLHQGQGNNKKQKIICEIKRNDHPKRYARLFADLYKLSCYMDKDMMGNNIFDYGVFILLSTTLDDIKKIKGKTLIKVNTSYCSFGEFKEKMRKHFDRLICVSYNGQALEYETLNSLLK